MTAKPVTVTLFAYNVGFGDCFLLRFGYDDDSRRHILIDFGTTGLPKDVEKDHMVKVAQDIAEKCREPGGDGIDLLVATHRHADHISGFATREDGTGPGDIIRGLSPKVVMQPWTEAPEAPVGWLGPESDLGGKAFAARRGALAAMHRLSEQAVSFAALAKGVSAEITEQIAFIGTDNLSNKSAIENLAAMGKRHVFAYHGCDIDLRDILPGVDFTVLGPPTLRQSDGIRKQRSKDEDEFWHMAPRRLAPVLEGTRSKKLFPNHSNAPASKLPVEHRWLARRMDELNGDLMLGLVRALDAQMNNTSIILHLRAGSKSLLFPGDAQLENWQYALQSPLAGLLDDVDLYKVGHHGSLNATPKSMWKRFRKKGTAKKKGRLTSVLSTRLGKHGSEEKRTEVPRASLVKELKAQSHLHSTEALGEGELYKEIELALA